MIPQTSAILDFRKNLQTVQFFVKFLELTWFLNKFGPVTDTYINRNFKLWGCGQTFVLFKDQL